MFSGAGSLTFISNIAFAFTGSSYSFSAMQATSGGTIAFIGDIKVGGNFGTLCTVTEYGVTRSNVPAVTVTFQDHRLGGNALTYVSSGKIMPGNMTFSGSSIGARYSAVQNGVINTNGGGANFFSSNVAGTFGTGGVYV